MRAFRFLLALLIVACLMAGLAIRIRREHSSPGVEEGAIYYRLAPSHILHFPLAAIGGLRLQWRAVGAAKAPAISLRFLGQGDVLLGQIEARPRNPDSPAQSLDLIAPAATRQIELQAQAEAYVRLSQASTNALSRRSLLRELRLQPAALTAADLQSLAAPRYAPLAAVGSEPSAMLAERAQARPAPIKAIDTDQVEPTHARVWNLLGRATGELTTTGHGTLLVDCSCLSRSEPVRAGESRKLEFGPGPGSLTVRSLGDAMGEARLTLKDSEHPPESLPAEVSVYAEIARPASVQVSLEGQGPVEPLMVEARALLPLAADDPHRVHWAFRGADQKLLLHGESGLSVQPDDFATAETGSKSVLLTVAAKIFLVPPPGAALLELSCAAQCALSVKALLIEGESRSLPAGLAPAPAGFRWTGVPRQATAWVPLRLDAGSSVLALKLVRTPRLERLPEPPAAYRALAPLARKQGILLEQSDHPPSHPGTLVEGQTSARVRVPSLGLDARRLAAVCYFGGLLGGEERLLIDGAVAARQPILSNRAVLQAPAEPGVRRISFEGHRASECVLNVAPAAGAAAAKRTVAELPASGQLQVELERPRSGATAVFAAVYVPEGERTGWASLTLDGGHPVRAAGLQRQISHGSSVALSGAQSPPAWVVPGHRKVVRAAILTALVGDDLRPGKHVLSLDLTPGIGAFARFWVPSQAPKDSDRIRSWVESE